MQRPPDYGIIYNWDGAPHGYSEYPQSMEQFLDKAYSVMKDTQVGAHFWSTGGSEDGDLRLNKPDSYIHARHFTQSANILSMYDRGEDPHAALIQRGHELGMHVYASVRMNDNHFGGMQPHEMEHSKHPSLTQFRRSHPEYLLGDRAGEWFALSFDFAISEVRERRFNTIKELCENSDWDGVELDWQRHAFHFDEDYGYRMRYTLTDIQRAVRTLTNEISERRGKPFYLAARVNGYLEMCDRIGYDIKTWIEEDLVDIIIPAGGALTETEHEIAEFKNLCEGTNILVYPGFDTSISGAAQGPEDGFTKDQMMNRALAARHHMLGADGIYIFNWHANGETRRELLNTIGSPETLRRTDKIYAATRRVIIDEGEWRGAFWKDRIRGTVPVPLKRTLTGDGPTMILEVADDLTSDKPSHLELRFRLENWAKGDELKILWDGEELGDFERHYDQVFVPFSNQFISHVSDVSDAIWISREMTVDEVLMGLHQVKVILEDRNEEIDDNSDIILTDVELVIRYD